MNRRTYIFEHIKQKVERLFEGGQLVISHATKMILLVDGDVMSDDQSFSGTVISPGKETLIPHVRGEYGQDWITQNFTHFEGVMVDVNGNIDPADLSDILNEVNYI